MMEYGMLADHFDGAGAKFLADVEVNRRLSHQHEFQGIGAFRQVLGSTGGQVQFPATYYWMDDDEDRGPISISSSCTWNDVRRNQPGRSPEYRIYYPTDTEPIVHRAVAGDLLIIAKTKERKLLIILCPANSTTAQQMLWLFGLNPVGNQVDVKVMRLGENVQLGYAALALLNDLGIDVIEPEPDAFGQLIDRYGTDFPDTREFSQFARDTLFDTDPLASPDDALTEWMDHEQALFHHMERHIVKTRVGKGFSGQNGEIDVDGFTEFAVSVVNRRKSRAGSAFGHHVEAVLKAHGVRYVREARTENSKRPDFLFPGQAEYNNPAHPSSMLTMLGAKRTCKDRWRQVLSEANRITNKHLLTLEPAISIPQTNEMRAADLQLVVPRHLFASYRQEQRNWLMDVAGFIELVKSKQ